MKIYCLDTNVLVESADALFAFEEHIVVIPFTVLIELDDLKIRTDSVGQNARRCIRHIDRLREQGSLVDGVKINGEGLLKVSPPVLGVSHETPSAGRDASILQTAQKLVEDNPEAEVTLITNDVNMRLFADVLEIKAVGFMWEGQPREDDTLYSGAAKLSVEHELIDKFYERKTVTLPELDMKLYPNQFLVLKNGVESQSAIAKYRDHEAKALTIKENSEIWGLKPRNKEQRFALDILMDKDIKLVTLIGRAGCGKTLMAIAAGMHQAVEKKMYSKVLVSRPIQAMGKDIGYLPGTLEEKMAPWIQPIKDNLLFLLKGNRNAMDHLFDDGTVEIEALTYIRGRSIPQSYIIIDECQNLSAMELKAIITRVGEGTKIVLTGDIEQIDNPYFDPMSNGLTYIIEKFKDQDVAGHIKLIKGERSPLATMAAKIL